MFISVLVSNYISLKQNKLSTWTLSEVSRFIPCHWLYRILPSLKSSRLTQNNIMGSLVYIVHCRWSIYGTKLQRENNATSPKIIIVIISIKIAWFTLFYFSVAQYKFEACCKSNVNIFSASFNKKKKISINNILFTFL